MEDEIAPLAVLDIPAPSSPAAAVRIVLDAEIIDACRTDHLRDGIALHRIASALDVPRRRVYAIWRKIVAGAQSAGILSPEDQDAMRAYILGTYEEIIEEAMGRIDEHAAYGAIAINALDKLWQAAGLDSPAAQAGGSNLKDRLAKLMEQGAKLSPLLRTKPGLASLDPKDVRQAKHDVEQWEDDLEEINNESGQESAPS